MTSLTQIIQSRDLYDYCSLAINKRALRQAHLWLHHEIGTNCAKARKDALYDDAQSWTMMPLFALGSTEKRATPIKMCQKRRNNRKLERFLDGKQIDKRTIGSSKKPKVLCAHELPSGRRTRNKNKSGPNLRIYRGKMERKAEGVFVVSATLESGDVVRWEGRKVRRERDS